MDNRLIRFWIFENNNCFIYICAWLILIHYFFVSSYTHRILICNSLLIYCLWLFPKVVTGAVIPILIMQMVQIKESKLKALEKTTQTDANNSTSTTEAWRNRMRKIYYFYTSPLLKFIFSLVSHLEFLLGPCIMSILNKNTLLTLSIN